MAHRSAITSSAASTEVVQKNSIIRDPALRPSNLSSRELAYQGVEPLVGDWSGVFRLETFFNPQSAKISDALSR